MQKICLNGYFACTLIMFFSAPHTAGGENTHLFQIFMMLICNENAIMSASLRRSTNLVRIYTHTERWKHTNEKQKISDHSASVF